mmetsp:Transcript_58990/g.121985  ORF Transcript_58990/g.121985 Transcript_58990/m.121985 type:complete len:164 (-) Transcript_58990:481-972(-)
MARSEFERLEAVNQMGKRIGDVTATGKPDIDELGDFDFSALPPPCKPDIDLVDLCLYPVDMPLEVEGESEQEEFESFSWAADLRTPSTSSLTPRFRDVPPGTLLAPDGRAHWMHVLRMDEFCKDVAKCPPKFKYSVLRRHQRDLKPTQGQMKSACVALISSIV